MRIVKYALLPFLLLCLVAAIGIMSNEVSADTHVWDGNSGVDAKASTATNWVSDVAPEAGDDLVFSTGSAASTLDQAITYGSITINGYTGTITQGAVDFGYANFTMSSAATWTGVATNTQTCSGNFIQSLGAVPTDVLRLKMTGDGSQLQVTGATQFRKLVIDANVTAQRTGGTYNMVTNGLTVTTGHTLTIPANRNLHVYQYQPIFTGYYNNGSIAVGGKFYMIFGTAYDLAPGDLNGAVYLSLYTSAAASRIVTLTTDMEVSTLSIQSDHATYTITFDSVDKNLTTSGLTIGARGIFLGGEGTHHINGNWDSSNTAATWTPESSTVIFPDSNKTIKLAADQSFNVLQIAASSINPKWATNLAGGTLYLNITGLNASRTYNYYVDGVKQDPYDTTSTSLAWSYSTTGAHYFELREVALITPVPLDATPFLRHQVEEGVLYSVYYGIDQTVAWTLVTDAPFLVNEDGWIHGKPGYDDQGVYTVTLSSSNANGETSVSFILEVVDVPQPVDFGPVVSLVVIILVAGALTAMFGKVKWRKA